MPNQNLSSNSQEIFQLAKEFVQFYRKDIISQSMNRVIFIPKKSAEERLKFSQGILGDFK